MASFDALIRANKRNTVILVAVVTVVLCVLAGAIGLVVAGWSHGGAGDPRDPGYHAPPPIEYTLGVSIVTALAVAVVMAAFSYYAGASTILAISGAREIRKSDDPQLFNIVEELSIASGLPMPKVYVIGDSALNAFATGRDPRHAAVAVTDGLRRRLTRDELQGVMAHELAHVRNYDIRLAMFTAVMVGLIVLMADFFMRYLWWGGGRRRGRSGGGGGHLVIVVVAIVLALLAPLFAKIIQLAISRQREYLADAAGAEMTRYPEGLASALAKLESDTEVLEAANRGTAHLYIVNPFKRGEKRFKVSSLFRTHPEIGDRIARLMKIGGGGDGRKEER